MKLLNSGNVVRWVRPRVGIAGAIVALALAVSACGSSSKPESHAAQKESGASTQSSGGSSAGVSGLKVGYMTATPVNEGSWDPQIYAAVHPLAEKYKWDVNLAESVPSAQGEQVLKGFGAAGDGLVLVTSQEYESEMLKAAEEYPETDFVMLTTLASTHKLPNVAAYKINWNQFGYLGGAAAGAVSKTDEIGLICGQPITPCLQAFADAPLGAKVMNSKATTKVEYTGTWTDSAKAAQTAAALVGAGAGGVFPISGGTEGAIMQSVAKAGAYGIGAYADGSHYAPGHVPTSVALEWKPSMQSLVEQLSTKSFEPVIHEMTVQNGGITLIPLKEVAGAAEKGKALEKLVSEVKEGKISVPTKELSSS